MKPHRWTRCSAALALTWVVAAMTVAPCAERLVLSEDPSGAYIPEGERRLVIRGIRGEVFVRLSDDETIKFLCSEPGGTEQEMPLTFGTDGRSLFMEVPDWDDPVPRRLWTAVPPGIGVEIRLDGAVVKVHGLEDDLSVSGRELDLSAEALRGDAELRLERSDILLQRIEGDVTVRGTGIAGRIVQVGGVLELTAAGSDLALERIYGDLAADLTDTKLATDHVTGAVQLDADGGEITLSGLRNGGEANLDGAALVLAESAGNVQVETDSPVVLEENEATVSIESFGAEVSGTGVRGALTVKTAGSRVGLDTITAPLRIHGDGLHVALDGSTAEMNIDVTASEVRIEEAGGPLFVQNDLGGVYVKGSDSSVVIRSTRGDVGVHHARSSVDVEADGERLEVAWDSLPAKENSSLRNRGGEVWVWLPARGGCRLAARADGGRIQTDRHDVHIDDDGERASGAINRRVRPVLNVESGGDMYILSGAEGEDETTD